MLEGKIRTTEEQIQQAIQESAETGPSLRTIRDAKYIKSFDLVMLLFSDGERFDIPRKKLQGLRDASPNVLKEIQVLGIGTGICWPSLKVAFSVAGLLNRHYGNNSWMKMLAEEEREQQSEQHSRSPARVTA